MERMSYFVALSMGMAGLLCGLILAKRRSVAAEIARSQWALGFGLPLLVFVATLPSRPPFGSGQGFGRGFLLGGLGAMLAGWLVLRAERRDESRSGGMASVLALVSPQSVGLIVAVSPLLWMRANLLDTLLGVAIGWLCSSLPLLLSVQNPKSKIQNADSADALPLTAGIGFVSTLCALFALGEMRAPAALFHSPQSVSWNMVGAVLAASVPFLLLVSALPNTLFLRLGSRLPVSNLSSKTSSGAGATENAGRTAAFLRGALALLLFFGLSVFLSRRMMPQAVVWRLAGAGIVTTLLALFGKAWQAPQAQENPSAALQHHALGLLLFAAGGMISYQWLQGYGVGIWLMAAWLIVSMTLARSQEDGAPHRADVSRNMLNLALFGVILLLYRVVMSRFSEDIQPTSLTDQYALFGLLVGAFTPAFLGGYIGRGDNRLFRLLPVGLLTLAIPGVALMLYGAKCALALLIGAALSFASTDSPNAANLQGAASSAPTSRMPEEEANSSASSLHPTPYTLHPLLALALALALAQWTGRALDYTLLAKAQKLHLLEVIGGATVALMLLADYGGRFMAWRGTQNSAGTTGGTIGKGIAQ